MAKKIAQPKLAVTNAKRVDVPLIVEPHPKEYTGFPFITLIQYRKQPMLSIVDNATTEVIRAYVLDLCGPEKTDEELLISVAADWYTNNRANYPLSIEFSRRGMTSIASRVYRALNIEFVSRVIGPVPVYPMEAVRSVKRRRCKPISASVEIRQGNVFLAEQLFQQ